MGIRVLVIDTDETFRQNLAQRLLSEGCQVFTAANEIRSKKILQREKIDVALLGLSEVGQRGLSLLNAIKRIRPLTQVILMLPAEHLSLSIEGMRLGAFDDLLLPFDVETLLARIKAAYQHKQELQQTGKAIASRQRPRPVANAGTSQAVAGAEATAQEDDLGALQKDETEGF